MANRLDASLEAWKQGKDTGKYPASKTSNRLDSSLEEWKKKRKPIVDQYRQQRELEKQQQQEPIKPKPVDQIQREYKWTAFNKKEEVPVITQDNRTDEERKLTHEQEVALDYRKATIGEKFKSGVSAAGLAYSNTMGGIGRAIEGKGESMQAKKRIQDEELRAQGIEPVDTGMNALGEDIKEAGAKMAGFFDKNAKWYQEKIIPEYQTMRDDEGNWSKDKFKDPAAWAHQVASGGGSMLPMVATTGLSGGTMGGVVAGGAIMGVAEKGDAVQEFKEGMAHHKGVKPEELTDEDLVLIDEMSDIYGVLSMALESYAPSNLVKNIGAKQAANSLLKRVILETPPAMLKNGIAEGGTEWTQKFTQNIIERSSGINPEQDLTEGAADEGVTGFATGMFFGAGEGLSKGETPLVNPPIDSKIVQDETPPAPPEEEKKPIEIKGDEKVFTVLDSLDNNDTEGATAIANEMTTEELTASLEILDRAIDQADDNQVDSIMNDRDFIESILSNRSDAVLEKAHDIALEGKKEVLDNASENERAEIKKTLQQLSESTHESAKQAEQILKEVASTNKIAEASLAELDTMKKNLLAEKKQAEDAQIKKDIQAKIDEIDGARIEFKASKDTASINKAVEKMTPSVVRDTLEAVDRSLDELEGEERQFAGEKSNALRDKYNEYNDANKEVTFDNKKVVVEVVKYPDGKWSSRLSIDAHNSGQSSPFSGVYSSKEKAIADTLESIKSFIKSHKDNKDLPAVKKALEQLTEMSKESVITNKEQTNERANQNLGRSDNAGAVSGSLSVGESESGLLGERGKTAGRTQQREDRNNASTNGNRVSERQQLKLQGEYEDDGKFHGENVYASRVAFKKDVLKYLKAIGEELGWTPDFKVKKNGKRETISPDFNHDRATAIFWKNDNIGIYISVDSSLTHGDGNMDDGTRVSTIMYRATTPQDKYKGMENNFANRDVSVKQFADIIESLVEKAEQRLETKEEKVEEKKTAKYEIAEKQKTKIAQTILKIVKSHDKDINDENLYIKVKKAGYQDLYIERISEDRIAMAHTYEQNGDIMFDPEIVFKIQDGQITAETFENSGMGTGQMPIDDRNDFLDMWAENLEDQGFTKSLEQEVRENIAKVSKPTKKYTRAEIEKLAMSKDTFTEEEKDILRQYEGSGGQKDGEGRGVLDEYYTPKVVVDKVWQLIKANIDGKIEKVIEPSAGTGRFLEGVPKGASKAGFEINPVSAKIAEVLTGATIFNKPFEDLFIDEKGNKKKVSLDGASVVLGNPPYGEHRGKYKGLGEEPKIGRYEDYFIKRSLELTREGGIVAMVIPSGFIRGKENYAKQEIAKYGELIDAYRLPNGSFGTTDVGTDIVIFKRRPTLTGKDSDERLSIVSRQRTMSNDIFFRSVMNKDKILGEETTKQGRFGLENYTKGTLEDAMSKLVIDEVVAEEQAIEEFEDEDAEAVEMEQPLTPEIKKEAIKRTRVAKTRTTKAVESGKDTGVKGVFAREDKQKYKVKGTKKEKVKTFYQGTPLTAEEKKLYELTREDGTINASDLTQAEKNKLNFYKGDYVSDFNYYQGDIYDKLNTLEQDKDNIDPQSYERQKKGLQEIMPEPMTIKEITILPIDKLAKEIKTEDGKSLVDGFTNWLKDLPHQALEGASTWEIAGYLNGQPVRGGSVEQNNKEKVRRRKVGNKLFKKYYQEELSEKEQDKITRKFNETFNSYVRPDYKKYPINVSLFDKFYGRPFEIRPIQMEGAAFLSNKGVGLLAYEVGVGKTLAGIAAIRSVMEKGWTKKPLIIVPKNLKTKWIRDLAESMPNVKINDLSNLGGNFKYSGNVNDLEIEDGTISIITEDGFKRIGFSNETYERLTANLEDVMYSNEKKSKRGEEIDKAKTEEIVGKAMKKTDFPLTFEQLGFDHITIDEAHRAKNIFSKAKAKGEKGSSANEYGAIHGAMSERGLKTYLATQYVLEQNNGRNVFLLTATPFNNSPIEIYSMLSLMAKKRLEDLGIKNINDFISMFAELESKYAIKANGTVAMTDQIRKFSNLQQLQKLVREYIDFVTGEEAGIPRPEKVKKTPYLKMNAMQAQLVEQAQILFSPKFRQEGGTLKGISELQKITFSPYLSQFHPTGLGGVSAKDLVENSPKIKYAVESILKVHKTNPHVGQIIFSEKGIETFRKIKEHFVKNLGYKDSEVDIIDSSASDAVKDEVQDNFQTGKVRVLLASGTVKEGVDLQKNSTDLYNLYLPWNPTDMIQAEGRTWRQKSYYDKVRIHYPLIQNSVDPFIFQKLEEKASRIANVFSYKGNELDVSEIDFEGMKFELITDPVMRVEAKYQYDQAEINNKISLLQADIAYIERRIDKIMQLENRLKDYEGYKQSAKDKDDADDVAYYARKISEIKEEIKTENEKLEKKGLVISEITAQSAEKKTELEKLKKEASAMAEKLQEDLKVAKEQKTQAISGTNNYDEITSGMEDANFFTHDKEQFIGVIPPSFKKDDGIHANIKQQDIDAYARLMMENTTFEEFATVTKRLLKQHGIEMNVEMFHEILDSATRERALGIFWGDTIGGVNRVTRYTSYHEVQHVIERIIEQPDLIRKKLGYKTSVGLKEFERFDIKGLDADTAKVAGLNPRTSRQVLKEKRSELLEQYADRKENLKLTQRLKEYFIFVLKQWAGVRAFTAKQRLNDYFDQIYYGKTKEQKMKITDPHGIIKKMTRYVERPDGSIMKRLETSELEMALEGFEPSYKKKMEEDVKPTNKPLIVNGRIRVADLYRKVYAELYTDKPPALSSLEDAKIIKGTTKRAFTLGKRYATKLTKDNYKEVQKEIRAYIIKNIPTKHRGELLRAVISAKSKADVEIVIAKVDDMVAKGKGREIAAEKKKLMNDIYKIFLDRGMTERSTGRVNGAMLRQVVKNIAKEDGRVKMRQLTIDELEQMKVVAETLTQDKDGKIKLLSESKVDRIADLLPETLRDKEFITLGDIQNSFVNDDISGNLFGIFNKNLLRASRLVMIKNEITKKMYDKFTTAERRFLNEYEGFVDKFSNMYKDASGKMTKFRAPEMDEKIIDYLEGRTNGSEMSENEMKLANEIIQFYANSIEIMKPNRLRKYYFTHTRENFLEAVGTVGFKNAVGEFFNEQFIKDVYKDLPSDLAANLEFIIANNVFNPFGQPRSGVRYSQDLRKALQTYARVYFMKKNFDKLYSQSNAVLNLLPENMQSFFRRYVQSAKGRPEGRRYDPRIKRALELAVAWEYFKLLGANIASGIFNITVGTIDNFAAHGIFTKDSLVKGHARYITPQGFKMIHKYHIASRNVTYEMTQLMNVASEKANRLFFFQLGMGEHYLRGTGFLSMITKEEFESGKVSEARMSEIRHKLGEAQPLYGQFDSPVYGRHALGKTFYMFMTWLPTRLENWANWVSGATKALKNEEGLQGKVIENEDLHKIIRWAGAFILMSLMFGDTDRWKRQMEEYADLFSINYWVKLVFGLDQKPVWKDLQNVGYMLHYLRTQEQYEKDGTDYQEGDYKWEIYAKRLVEPTSVRRIEQGKNPFLEGWLPSEEKKSPYRLYNPE